MHQVKITEINFLVNNFNLRLINLKQKLETRWKENETHKTKLTNNLYSFKLFTANHTNTLGSETPS